MKKRIKVHVTPRYKQFSRKSLVHSSKLVSEFLLRTYTCDCTGPSYRDKSFKVFSSSKYTKKKKYKKKKKKDSILQYLRKRKKKSDIYVWIIPFVLRLNIYTYDIYTRISIGTFCHSGNNLFFHRGTITSSTVHVLALW